MSEMSECKWMRGEVWETECNEWFQFNSDGQEENDFRFCPFCGKRIVVCEEASDE